MALFNFLDKVVKFCLALTVATVFLLILASIFLRNFLSISLPWLEEFNNLLFVWIIFLGAAWGQVLNQQLAVGFLRDKFPGLSVLQLAVHAVNAAIGCTLCLLGVVYAVEQAQVSSLFMRIPYGYYIFPIVLLGFIVAVRDGIAFVQLIRERPAKRSVHEEAAIRNSSNLASNSESQGAQG